MFRHFYIYKCLKDVWKFRQSDPHSIFSYHTKSVQLLFGVRCGSVRFSLLYIAIGLLIFNIFENKHTPILILSHHILVSVDSFAHIVLREAWIGTNLGPDDVFIIEAANNANKQQNATNIQPATTSDIQNGALVRTTPYGKYV